MLALITLTIVREASHLGRLSRRYDERGCPTGRGRALSLAEPTAVQAYLSEDPWPLAWTFGLAAMGFLIAP
jgi:hypothetical protein